MTGTSACPLRHSSLLLFIADALLVGEAGKQTSAIIERSRRVSTSTVSVNGDEKGWGSEWHNYVLRIIICLVGFSVNGGLYVVIGDVLPTFQGYHIDAILQFQFPIHA